MQRGDGGQICEATNGTCYYLAPTPGSGSGTFEDPFGLADLPSSTDSTCALSSAAMDALNPGDILYFRGGTYTFATCPGSFDYVGYIRPARSGTATAPITFEGYPGETATLKVASGSQPALGNDSHDYVRFVGFLVDNIDGAGIRLGGSGAPARGLELSYTELIGTNDPANADNRECIRLEDVDGVSIHHCSVHGMQGNGHNNAGIKLYRVSNAVIEDNWIYGNTCGVFDKESGYQNTYRRNWFTQNDQQFEGNNQGNPLLAYLYENVFDGEISLHYLADGIEVHDNLVRASSLAGSWAGQVYRINVWNNVVISKATAVTAFTDEADPYVATGAQANLAYMDFNVYDAQPTYAFGTYTSTPVTKDMAQMRSDGFELSSTVVSSGLSVYADETSYALNSSWKTAGRYADPVGPDDVAAILDTSRYGFAARP